MIAVLRRRLKVEAQPQAVVPEEITGGYEKQNDDSDSAFERAEHGAAFSV